MTRAAAKSRASAPSQLSACMRRRAYIRAALPCLSPWPQLCRGPPRPPARPPARPPGPPPTGAVEAVGAVDQDHGGRVVAHKVHHITHKLVHHLRRGRLAAALAGELRGGQGRGGGAGRATPPYGLVCFLQAWVCRCQVAVASSGRARPTHPPINLSTHLCGQDLLLAVGAGHTEHLALHRRHRHLLGHGGREAVLRLDVRVIPRPQRHLRGRAHVLGHIWLRVRCIQGGWAQAPATPSNARPGPTFIGMKRSMGCPIRGHCRQPVGIPMLSSSSSGRSSSCRQGKLLSAGPPAPPAGQAGRAALGAQQKLGRTAAYLLLPAASLGPLLGRLERLLGCILLSRALHCC